MKCGSMTLGNWGQGLVLGSFCNQACHDDWHKDLVARQAAQKLRYDIRPQTIKPDIDPDGELHKCFHCLQYTPKYMTMCGKCGRCQYHPDGGIINEDSKENFQRLMEMTKVSSARQLADAEMLKTTECTTRSSRLL